MTTPWCSSSYRTATCLIIAGHDGNHAGNDLDGSWLRWTDADSEPWCSEHGYGCEPQSCPCGHSLRCDCWSIANEH